MSTISYSPRAQRDRELRAMRNLASVQPEPVKSTALRDTLILVFALAASALAGYMVVDVLAILS